ncbi:MAG: hypothetical protein COW54_14720 [Rhodobacteraceae bacterium CG17_big_fil_post_rev_8_21_14_2_50_63_15]|nr:Hint domain-containing protein [Roseovarius sp.]PIV77424.1 MAG: hypothetical protein COW54_14720 [Rhodobacteraceae bacterium CG17_big_fil_post_rev_8_21_14_2_50_63_15]
MANYSIWMLEAQNVTVSGGKSLSGFTQGNGSHLLGETIRLNNNNWLQTFIKDNDSKFDDQDADQPLDGPQIIDGVSYGNETRVEAEYRLTLLDPATGNTWNVIGYNVNNSSPAFGTIEGLAFVGPVGGFPPIGVDLQVTGTFEGPGAAGQPPINAGAIAAPPCFTPGTRILAEDGYIPVEDLRVGDRVRTRDAGLQQLLWVGRAVLSAADLLANPSFQPVCIRADAFGPGQPARDLLVSPQHRILVRNWAAELHFGTSEVLVAAQHLINDQSVTRTPAPDGITYLHIMCAAHHVIWAEGLETETFLPGPQSLGHVPRATVEELLALFPELQSRGRPPFDPARPVLRAWEARMMAGVQV